MVACTSLFPFPHLLPYPLNLIPNGYYRTIDKVDATVAEIQEHMQVANEVSDMISTANYGGPELDEVCLVPIITL